MSPLLSGECDAIRHPGQVPQRGTRAGIQKGFDYIGISLDSPSILLRVVSPSTLLRTVSLSNDLSNHGPRPAEADSSGMTGSTNCDIVSQEKGHFLRNYFLPSSAFLTASLAFSTRSSNSSDREVSKAPRPVCTPLSKTCSVSMCLTKALTVSSSRRYFSSIYLPFLRSRFQA
jgi:hypothetical protein